MASVTDPARLLLAEEVALTEEIVFYNRYFWFVRLTHLCRLDHGPDAGFEQMLFQLLEHPPAEADWAVLEEIHQLAAVDSPGRSA